MMARQPVADASLAFNQHAAGHQGRAHRGTPCARRLPAIAPAGGDATPPAQMIHQPIQAVSAAHAQLFAASARPQSAAVHQTASPRQIASRWRQPLAGAQPGAGNWPAVHLPTVAGRAARLEDGQPHAVLRASAQAARAPAQNAALSSSPLACAPARGGAGALARRRRTAGPAAQGGRPPATSGQMGNSQPASASARAARVIPAAVLAVVAHGRAQQAGAGSEGAGMAGAFLWRGVSGGQHTRAASSGQKRRTQQGAPFQAHGVTQERSNGAHQTQRSVPRQAHEQTVHATRLVSGAWRSRPPTSRYLISR